MQRFHCRLHSFCQIGRGVRLRRQTLVELTIPPSIDGQSSYIIEIMFM